MDMSDDVKRYALERLNWLTVSAPPYEPGYLDALVEYANSEDRAA